MNKTLIIGWDGATFSVLQPLIEQGYMPNLEALLRQGAKGTLRSTIPPSTAAAWTSFITGVNPGKHGLTTWQRPIAPNTTSKRWVNSGDVYAPRLWDWLPDVTVGVLNLPVTYPPMKVNGFVVSGMLTPSSAKSYTYPPDLQEMIEQVADGYVLDIDLFLQPTAAGGAVERTANKQVVDTSLLGREKDFTTEIGQLAFLEALRRACKKRTKVVLALWEKYQPDLYIVMFETPDRIQHTLWRYAKGDDFSNKSKAVQKSVIDCYRELDAILGTLLDRIAYHTLFLISDHGFCGQHTLVHINGWLAEQGLLTYQGLAMTMRGPLRRLFRILRNKLPLHLRQKGRAAFNADSLINLERTQAYSGIPIDHCIHINLQGRDPFGSVKPGEEYETLRQRLHDGLLALKDERNNTPIFRKVYLREEIYHGQCIDLAPDIVFELTPGYKLVTTPSQKLVMEDVIQAGEGFHEREGIIVMKGAGVIPGREVENADIIDVAPTVMYALGAKVPNYLDGKVLTGAFSTTHLHERPPSFTDTPVPDRVETLEEVYNDKDQEAVENRLRNLGYL